MTDTLATIGFRADTRDLDQADVKLKKLGSTGEQTEKKINDANKGMSDSFRSSTAAVSALTAGLGALAATVSVGQVIQYSDGWKSFNNVLRQVTTSEADFIKTQQSVLSLAKQTNSNLLSTAELYGELTRATSDLGLSSERVLGVTGTINKLFLAGGKSAAEASGSIRQLAQALAAGALRGDEFNSVAEGAPRILDALAKQLNMTRGELREFAATGGITAEIMVKALEGYATEADKMVGVTQRTFAQTNEIIQANITEWIGSSKSLQAVTESVGSSLLSVSENLEPLARALGVGASILGGAWVLSAGRAAAANIALGAATAGVTTATYALTAATRLLMGPLGLVITAAGAAAIAFDSYAKDADSARLATEKLNQEWERSSNAARAQQYVAAQQRIIDIERQLIEEEKKLQEAMKQTGTGMFGNTTATANQARVISELGKEKAALQAKIEGMNKAFDDSLPPITGQTLAVKSATKSAKELAKEMANIQRIQDGWDEYWYDEIESGLEEMDRIAEENAVAEMERIDKAIEDIDRYVGVSEKAAERIEEAFADAWMNAFDGFESVVDGMKNAFKRMLAEMAHMALTRPIMISMGMGGMLPGGASASSLGGAASSMGLLGSIGGGITGLGSLIGGSFGGGLMGGGALVGAGQFGTLFSGAGSLLGSGNIMAGLGMATPIIAGLGAALAGIQKLSGGGLFGTSFKTTGQSLGLSLGGGDITGSITTEESRKKSLFRGTKRRTSTSGYDASAIDDAFDAISESLLAAATTFGIEGADAVIKGFASSVNIDIKDKTEAEIQDAIAAWVGSTTEGLVNAVFGDSLDGLQKEGEGVVDTVNRLAMNMQAVKGVTDVLGVNFGLTGKAAMVAATNIVELAGGLEQLSALTSQYYSAFYSDAEQQANLVAQLSESFAALNVTMPDTREGFRALVDGLDLTSEAGQKMFAELMKLVPGMDQYLSALEAQRQASEEAAEAARKEAEAKAAALKAQGLDLQLRLYEALGQSAEALALKRQMELEATDESLRAMLLAIYAAEDAAKAQEELAAAQEKAAASARSAAQDAFGKLSDSINTAIKAQDDILQSRLDSINSERDAIYALIDAQDAMTESLKEAASNAFGKLEEAANREISASEDALQQKLSAIDAERNALNEAANLSQKNYSEQISAAERYADSIRGISDVLSDFLDGSAAAVNPFKRLTEILSEAKAGLLPNQSELSSVLSGVSSAGSAGFASAFDQSRANAIAKNQAAELKSLVGAQVGSADAQVSAIQAASASAQTYYEAQLARLDLAAEEARAQNDKAVAAINAQVDAAKRQLNALQSIDDRALSVEQALREFNAAMTAVNGQAITNYADQLAALDEQEKLAISQHEESVNALNAQLDEAKKRLNVLLGIDDRILSVEQAMDEFNKAMLAAQDAQVTAIARVEEAILQVGETIVEIGKPDDRVWIPPTMPDRYTTDAPISKEVTDLLKKLVDSSKANAEHASKSASFLQEMTIGGIDVRFEP